MKIFWLWKKICFRILLASVLFCVLLLFFLEERKKTRLPEGYKFRYEVYRRTSLYSHLFSTFFISFSGLIEYGKCRFDPFHAFFYSIFALLHDYGKKYSILQHNVDVYPKFREAFVEFLDEQSEGLKELFKDVGLMEDLFEKYESFFKLMAEISFAGHHSTDDGSLFYNLGISNDHPAKREASEVFENVFISDKFSRIFELRIFTFIDTYVQNGLS